MTDSSPHQIDDYLARAEMYSDDGPHRKRALNALEQLSDYLLPAPNSPLPLTIGEEIGDALYVYLYAHERADDLTNSIPDHLKRFAERARKHVGNGGEFCIDHALGIIDPQFKGPRPKGPGEHRHHRLFLLTFYNCEVAHEKLSQIAALRDAAELVGLQGYEEKYLDGEYRTWRDKNTEWLTWVFDLV